MSFNTKTGSITTGFLTTTAGSTFQGNVNVNNTLFVNNQIRNSSENAKEIILLASNDSLAMRPYKISDYTLINESFSVCYTSWETTPEVPPIIPAIDLLLYVVTAPIGNNTIGRIVSDHTFRICANDTDNIYATNIDPSGTPTNGLDRGLYIYIPATVPARHYAITRPLRAFKQSAGITGNGLSFELKFLFAYPLVAEQKCSFGFAQSNASATLNGNNLSFALNSFGFVIDYALFGSYSIRPYVRNSGGSFTYSDIGLNAEVGKVITLKMNWDYEHENLTFFIDNGTDTLTRVAGVDFASNPLTSLLFDPFICVYNPTTQVSGVVFNKWVVSFYKYSA